MKPKICKSLPLLLLLISTLASDCGSVGGEADVKGVTYSLDRDATNKTSNKLYLNLSNNEGYTFAINGDGFNADIAFDTRLPIVKTVNLSYSQIGTYILYLKIYYADGSILLEDALVWRFNTVAPVAPQVTFDEDGTKDQDVNLVVPLSLDQSLHEVWVQGDIVSTYKKWHAIPDDRKIPIKVTSDDGLKSLRVKYRNIYGTESTWQDLEIRKKSTLPTNCVISVDTSVTGSGSITVYMSASNEDLPLYYLISGDVSGSSGSWTSFENNTTATATIIDNSASNTVRVNVRDVAGNACDEATFNISYQEGRETNGISVLNNALWTDDRDITVLPTIDQSPSDSIEMYIHGDIADTSSTFEWIAFQSSVSVNLNAVDGNRHVRVKYRVNGGEESAVKSVAIYLVPFIKVTSGGPPYTLTLSEIVDLSSLTVTGCTETYNNVSPTTSVSCTPTAGSATVTYNLTDGTTVQRTTSVP